MKKQLIKTIFVLLVILISTKVYAQVPQGFNFQAVARSVDGLPLIEQELGIQVTILMGSERGEAVYTETHLDTTNAVGLLQLVIGEGIPSEGNNFSSVNWASGDYYVKLAIDPTGGTSYEDLGTTRLLSVPYALFAQNVINGGATDSTANNGFNDFIEINTDNAALQDSLTIIRAGSESEEELAYGLNVIGLSTGRNRPIHGEIREEAANGASQFAVSGTASGQGNGTHIGMIGTAWNPDATNGTRYGVYGQAASQAKYNYGLSGVASGSGNGDEGKEYGQGSINFGLSGYAEGNLWNNTGLEANASGENGKWNFGVHGLSSAGVADSVINHGVAGRAFGPGVNYGVYGSAWEGVENWAGYFDGDVNVNGTLMVNGSPIGSNGSSGFPDSTGFRNIELLNTNQEKAARLLTTQSGAGQLYFYQQNNAQPTAWFGNYGIGGFVQVVGYNEDESYAGGTLIGSASWNNNLPFFSMEGTSTSPFVSLVSMGGRLNDLNNEVPYFELQSTQRGIDQKGTAISMGVSNSSTGNDPDGTAGEMILWGNSSPNVQISGQTWENSDLGYIQLWGSTEDGNGWYHNNVFLTVSSDGTDEWGDLSLSKTNIAGMTTESMISLNGSDGSVHASSAYLTGEVVVDGDLTVNGSIIGSDSGPTTSINVVDANENSAVDLYAEGENQDQGGGAFFWGPNTPNIQMGAQSWNNADMAYIQLFGNTPDGNDWYVNNAGLFLDTDGTHDWATLSLNKSTIADGTSEGTIQLDGYSGKVQASELYIEGDTANDEVKSISGGSISGGQNPYTDGFVLNHNQSGGPLLEMFVSGTKMIDINGSSGGITVTSLTETSDRRLKTNIQPLSNALDNTLQLRGVSYNWIDKYKSADNQIGVIAQEVEKVYPEFVHTDEDGMKSVNYSQMVAVLIEAVKDLNAKIEVLESENSDLKDRVAEIDGIKSQLDTIMRLINTETASVGKSVSEK